MLPEVYEARPPGQALVLDMRSDELIIVNTEFEVVSHTASLWQ